MDKEKIESFIDQARKEMRAILNEINTIKLRIAHVEQNLNQIEDEMTAVEESEGTF